MAISIALFYAVEKCYFFYGKSCSIAIKNVFCCVNCLLSLFRWDSQQKTGCLIRFRFHKLLPCAIPTPNSLFLLIYSQDYRFWVFLPSSKFKKNSNCELNKSFRTLFIASFFEKKAFWTNKRKYVLMSFRLKFDISFDLLKLCMQWVLMKSGIDAFHHN